MATLPPDATIPLALTSDVELLSLDAGNTIVFLDHDAVAEAGRAGGVALDPQRVARAEAAAKRRLEGGGGVTLAPPVPDPDISPTWGAWMRTIVHLAAELDDAAGLACVRALWRAHRAFNLWRRVPPGLIDAVQQLRAAGVPVCVVSNSEGRLAALFDQLGIATAFDLVIDSHVVGVEKPDPAIFRRALAHFGAEPSRTLHLGDIVPIDVVGARAAGLRAALVDPLGHYAGTHPDVPRVDGVGAVARAIARARLAT